MLLFKDFENYKVSLYLTLTLTLTLTPTQPQPRPHLMLYFLYIAEHSKCENVSLFQHELDLLHKSAKSGDLMTISKLAGEKRCAWCMYRKT